MHSVGCAGALSRIAKQRAEGTFDALMAKWQAAGTLYPLQVHTVHVYCSFP